MARCVGGVAALKALPRRGRPSQLTAKVQKALEEDLERTPLDFGLNRDQWDGPTLVVHMKRRFGIKLKVRQVQMWMHRLGYRLKHSSYVYLQGRAGLVRHPQGNRESFLLCLKDIWLKTRFIEPGSPWENGDVESFHGKLRDELLNGELFDTLLEAQMVIESWRIDYNRYRPHSSLGYRSPAPEAFQPRFPTLQVVQ